MHIDGTSQSDDGLVVDVTVTCDRAVPEGWVDVEVVGSGRAWSRRPASALWTSGPAMRVHTLAVPITSFTGKLVGGPTDVEAFVQIYDFTPTDEFFDHARPDVGPSARLGGGPRVQVMPNPDSRITITGTTRDTLTGTITCEEPADVELQTVVQQSTGRTIDAAFRSRCSRVTDPLPSRSSSTGELRGGRHPPSSTPRPSRRRRTGTSSCGMTSRPPPSTSGADGPPRQARVRRAGPLVAIALATLAGVWAVVGLGVGAPGAERQLRRGALPPAGRGPGLRVGSCPRRPRGTPHVPTPGPRPSATAATSSSTPRCTPPCWPRSDVATGSQRPALGRHRDRQGGARHRASCSEPGGRPPGGAARRRGSLPCTARAAARHHLPVVRHQPRPPARGRHPHRGAWRTGARWAAVGVGLCWGLAAFARPYDAVLHGRGDRQRPRAWCWRWLMSRSVAAAGTLGWPGRPRCGGPAAGVARLQPRHDR